MGGAQSWATTSWTVSAATERASGHAPTFYRDVLPILQEHCEICHRADGIAPMAFRSYEETRAYAEAIRTVTRRRSMPPWFAVPGIGHFANDPSLTAEQIATLAAWAEGNAPEGNPRDALHLGEVG